MESINLYPKIEEKLRQLFFCERERVSEEEVGRTAQSRFTSSFTVSLQAAGLRILLELL